MIGSVLVLDSTLRWWMREDWGDTDDRWAFLKRKVLRLMDWIFRVASFERVKVWGI